jgi:hypothetical protein
MGTPSYSKHKLNRSKQAISSRHLPAERRENQKCLNQRIAALSTRKISSVCERVSLWAGAGHAATKTIRQQPLTTTYREKPPIICVPLSMPQWPRGRPPGRPLPQDPTPGRRGRSGHAKSFRTVSKGYSNSGTSVTARKGAYAVRHI